MKISILQENLSKAALAISKIVSSKPQLPIFIEYPNKSGKRKNHVLGNGFIDFNGADGWGKIEEDGEIAVPAKEFSALITQLAAGKVDLSSEKSSLSVKAGSSKGRLIGVSGEDFPKVEPPAGQGIKIKTEDLSFLLRGTLCHGQRRFPVQF